MRRCLGETWRTRIWHDEFLAPETGFRVLIANVPEPCLTADYARVTCCAVAYSKVVVDCCGCDVQRNKSRCGQDGCERIQNLDAKNGLQVAWTRISHHCGGASAQASDVAGDYITAHVVRDVSA